MSNLHEPREFIPRGPMTPEQRRAFAIRIGRRIAVLQNGRSNADLARQTGLTRTRISGLRAGQAGIPGGVTLVRLGWALADKDHSPATAVAFLLGLETVL